MLTQQRHKPYQVSPTQNVKELQCFTRMVKHLRKFIPRLAEMSEPVRQLLCKDSTWLCTDPQQRAVEYQKQIQLDEPD